MIFISHKFFWLTQGHYFIKDFAINSDGLASYMPPGYWKGEYKISKNGFVITIIELIYKVESDKIILNWTKIGNADVKMIPNFMKQWKTRKNIIKVFSFW